MCVCENLYLCLNRSVGSNYFDPWTVVQAPLSMGFSSQENWSRLPFPSPGHLPDQGSNQSLLHCRENLSYLSHQGCPSYTFTFNLSSLSPYIHTQTDTLFLNHLRVNCMCNQSALVKTRKTDVSPVLSCNSKMLPVFPTTNVVVVWGQVSAVRSQPRITFYI